MTYNKTFTILASDYNNFVGSPTGGSGSNKVLVPFANSSEATAKAAGLYGVGYGDRGYGQTSQTLPNKSSGDLIENTEWASLLTSMQTCASHLNITNPQIPLGSSIIDGALVQAYESSAPASSVFDVDGLLSSIDTNRLNAPVGSMTYVSNAITATRSTSWNATIDCTIGVTFSSDNDARYFFNSGGDIRFRLRHTNTSTSQNTNWNTTLLGVNTFIIKANSFSRTGILGSISGAGYYSLSNSFVRYFDGTNIGTGAYSANDVYIEARYSAGSTTNGAKGSALQIKIILQDQYAGGGDSVAAGTKVEVDYSKATSYLTIPTPSFSIVDGF